MHKFCGSFLVVLTLLAGCGSGSGGGGGGGGNNNIKAALSTNADLSDLILSAGPLDQVFQASQTSYTATVGFLLATTTVTPTTDDANATVTVNGAAVISGTASDFISLDEGPNTIMVIVT
ncbi:MAG: cadherin-like beta sandwich domain-containing protein, partial [Gammaproteobacteria bacterium]|nr:cadherin-like beta sandwich domain-containing protein [Gammaproteobacteria bacterium]